MRHRKTAALVMTALTLAAGIRPGPSARSLAAEPDEKDKDKEKSAVAGKAQPERIKETYPPKPSPPNEPPPADGGPAAFVYTTDEAIHFFEARVKASPNDFHSLRYLGEMHERKARESGDLAEYAKAEAALRQALDLFPKYPRAQASLAAVLCSRHKFAEGLSIARELVTKQPKDVDALSTLGDALQELGRYGEAEEAYQKIYKLAPIPEVVARLANLAELKGQSEEARAQMQRAAEQALATDGPKAAAWFEARLGEMAFEAGRIDEAESYYLAVPKGVDAYHDATAGLGRVRAAQGRIAEAIELYTKAVAIGPDPHMLAALGDLYVRDGRPELARPVFDRLLKVAGESPEHRRNLAMFLADHDRDLPHALDLVRLDISERQDIYGHDALAWVLYKNGELQEAAKSSADAMKLGTRDAKLYYHAGMIHYRLGDREKARGYLARALEINPYFSPSGAEEARRTLASLGVAPASPAGP